MSLAKIPLIWAASYGLYIGHTPPTNARPPSTQRIQETKGPLRLTHFLPYAKYISWIVTITETAAIIASWMSQSTISRNVLAMTLMIDNNVKGLRLTPLSVFGAILVLLGALVRKRCYKIMGEQFTFELSIRGDHKLVTGGPYALVRHPGYTSGATTIIGTVCVHISRGSWVRESGALDTTAGRVLVCLAATTLVAPLAYIRKRVEVEDAALKQEFGSAWEKWAKDVPYRLIPSVY